MPLCDIVFFTGIGLLLASIVLVTIFMACNVRAEGLPRALVTVLATGGMTTMVVGLILTVFRR